MSSSYYNIDRCPDCGWPKIAVRVTSWADFYNGWPDCFDDEDIGYVEPIAGGEAFCRRCGYNWIIVVRAVSSDEELARAMIADSDEELAEVGFGFKPGDLQ